MHLIALFRASFFIIINWCRLLRIVKNSPIFWGAVKSPVCQNNGFLGTLVIRAIFGLLFGLSEPNPDPDGAYVIFGSKNEKNTIKHHSLIPWQKKETKGFLHRQ
jgi:hypothetical protein